MGEYFHEQSLARLEKLAADLPQSVMIHGPAGIGLSAASKRLATTVDATIIEILPERDEVVDLEKGTISIASIRRLYDITKTIETGRRIVVIDYAERMAIPAQNAFLKLLEEPGERTHFVLLTHEPDRLLPTIVSRVQPLEIRPITDTQSRELLSDLEVKDEQKRAQLLFIASGKPAELTRLAQDEAYFAARSQIVRDARSYLRGSAYDRLTLAQKYKDDRAGALTLLDDALNQIRQNVESGTSALLNSIDPLLAVRERIEANGNVRLQLAAAMV